MIQKENLVIFNVRDEFQDSNFIELEKNINSLIMKGDKTFVLDLNGISDISPNIIQNLTVLANRVKKNLGHIAIICESSNGCYQKLTEYNVAANIPVFSDLGAARSFLKEKRQSSLQYFTMEMAFSGELDNLNSIREFIWSVLHNLPLTEEEGNLIVLSIDEAVANIMKYAYQGSNEKHLIVQAQYKAPKLRFVLVDNGDQFDPTEKEAEKMDVNGYIREGHHGGLGIYIIEQVMDSFQHLFVPGMGNRLILEKEVGKLESSDR